MDLDSSCLDRWIGDFEEFRYEFLRFCREHSKALDYDFDFSQEILGAAHAAWHADHQLWLAQYLDADSSGLSHVKIMGLLLHNLCRANWITEVREYPNEECQFAGSPEHKDLCRADFCGGPEVFCALHFAIFVINWFESGREDCVEPFRFRFTQDMLHDLMFYLLSDHCNQFGIVLILKAIYMRDKVI